jgi:hypothetical protein
METSFLNNRPQCAVCGKPVKLEASQSNETGKAIHSECAVESNSNESRQHERDTQRRAS